MSSCSIDPMAASPEFLPLRWHTGKRHVGGSLDNISWRIHRICLACQHLVEGDSNGGWDVFVHHPGTGILSGIGEFWGEEGNSFSWNGGIHGWQDRDFSSFASNLVQNDTNGTWDALPGSGWTRFGKVTDGGDNPIKDVLIQMVLATQRFQEQMVVTRYRVCYLEITRSLLSRMDMHFLQLPKMYPYPQIKPQLTSRYRFYHLWDYSRFRGFRWVGRK